jgi:hypothetical protein
MGIKRNGHGKLMCSWGDSERVVEVSYHDKVNVLQEHKLAYNGPFDRPEWFTLLAESANAQPVVAQAQDHGELAALPLKKGEARLEPLVNWYSFTWRPLFSPRADRAVMLEAIARSLRQHARRVTLWPLPDEDDSATLLESRFRKAGWIVFRTACDTNHILRVRGRSYADYLASCPGPLRTTLKRKAKKIEIDISDIFQDNIWEIYQSIYQRSWKPEEGDQALLRHFAEAEGKAGHIRLGIAYHQQIPVAAQLWTVEGDTAYIHKLAHLEDAHPLSAGSVLTAALMEYVIDTDKVEIVDFGTGDDHYKKDWMDDVRPRFMLDCHDAKNPHSWPHILRGAARRVASRFRAS